MDYFKHYSTASDSKSMNALYDEYGHRGIAFWWMLLELCAENWDGHSEPKFVFHPRLVATKLKTRSTLVQPYLNLCSNLGMGKFQVSSTKIEIHIPKLAEVKTSRKLIKSNKNQLVVYIDKDKEEEKDKEEAASPAETFGGVMTSSGTVITPQIIKTLDQLLHLWNELAPKHGLKPSPLFCSGSINQHFRDIHETLARNKIGWDVYLDKIINSDFLMNQKTPKITVQWVINPDNFDKVMAGNFENPPDEEAERQARADEFMKSLFPGQAI